MHNAPLRQLLGSSSYPVFTNQDVAPLTGNIYIFFPLNDTFLFDYLLYM